MESFQKNLFAFAKSHLGRYGKYYAILISITVVFILIEIRHPFYFLQDDVRGYYFPAAVHNYRSLLDGQLALFNFHQYAGSTALACMEPATLYPLQYISIFLSSLFSGNYFFAIEILIYIHLIIAGFGFFKFFKVLDFSDTLSVFGAITWPLCSFVMFVSNSWVHIAFAAAYFPWMIFFSISFFRTLNLKYMAGIIISRISLLFSGHPEYFVYSMIFEGLTVLLFFIPEMIHRIKKDKVMPPFSYILKRVLLILSGYALTFAFSLPFVLPGLQQIGNSAEKAAKIAFDYFVFDTIPILDFFIGLLNPTQISTSRIENWAHSYNLTFIGIIPVIFLFITIFEIVRKRIKREKILLSEIRMYMMAILGLIAFLWVVDKGLFARILYNIPFINRTYFHFKITLFFNFYLITFSAYGIHRLYRRYKSNEVVVKTFHKFLSVCILLQLATFAALYLYLPHMCFGYHLDKLPYNEPLKDRISDGRYMSGGFNMYSINSIGGYSTNAYSFAPIAYNYASLWGLYTVAGYEPLISDRMSIYLTHHGIYQDSLMMPVDFLRKWGVKYYIIRNGASLLNTDAKEIYRDEQRIVYEDRKARPMFFFEKPLNSDTVIDARIRANTIELSFDLKTDDVLTFTFLYNRFFKAYIDNKYHDIGENSDRQVVLPVNSGKHSVVLKYVDPNFNLGAGIALVTLCLCVVSIAAWYFAKVKRKSVTGISR